MASYDYTFTSGDTVTPTKLNDARTVSDIVNADIKSDAAIAGTKIAPAFGGQDITVSTANRSITNTGNFALSFGTNNTERMRIDASGNVMINATSSTDKLLVDGTVRGTIVKAARSSGGSVTSGGFELLIDGNTQCGFYAVAAGSAGFYTGGSERMRIDASGNVGIGNTSPSVKLDVTGDINCSEAYGVDGVQVVSNRRTGWTAATGTATRTTFATSTVTTAQLAERVKALIDDLSSHGLIGT